MASGRSSRGRVETIGAWALALIAVPLLLAPPARAFEAFEGRDGPALWVHASDPHPNEEAHAVAASFAATKLSGLVPACGGAPTEAEGS